ncbi:MAG: TonB family protein [Nannocystaceae bacterium]|nr:TonB family protein [Nannocystaceae bacterium]
MPTRTPEMWRDHEVRSGQRRVLFGLCAADLFRGNLSAPTLSFAFVTVRGPWCSIVLVAIAGVASGCAGWIDDDEPWTDEDDVTAQVAPSAVIGYGGSPPSPAPPDFDEWVLLEPAEGAEPAAGGQYRGGHARVISTCTLSMHTARVRPTLERLDVQRTVRRHENDVRVCYNAALRRDPTLRGRVGLEFVIDPDGTVPNATIASAGLRDAEMHRCLVSTVKRWRFPTPPGTGTVVVHYPYVFSVPSETGPMGTGA